MLNIRMQNKEAKRLSPKITVVGVGGAGGNAVNNMISSGLQGVEFVVCNTDAQALEGSLCPVKMQLGVTVTGGLGAGAKPEVGRAAAEESLDDVMQYLEGANMAFITAGMGGGTGTGAAPVIARACREKGVLTVGVVTKPFHFEGSLRMRMAEEGIREMQEYVDTLIVIPNQNLFRVANERTTFAEAFRMADSVLQSGVRGVTDLMVMPGLINLDFADIRSAMLEMGKAMMGTGEASGERRSIEAAEKAINNPLLDDVSMKGARGVIINVTGGYDMTLFEVDEACNRIRDEVDPNANIIFGSTFDEALEGIMRVSVVATGIDVAEMKGRRPASNNININTITAQQQERRFERTVPQTPLAAEPVAAAPVYTPAAMRPSSPVSSYVSAAALPLNIRASAPPPVAGALAHKYYEEQQPQSEWAQPEIPVVPAPRPLTGFHAGQVQGQTTLRGSMYGESFIPPQAVEPEASRASETGWGSPMGGLTASRVPADVPPQTLTSPGLVLRPPPAPAPKKRTPSLFERFTGPLWSHAGRGAEQQQESRGTAGETGSSSGGFAPPPRAATPPIQGSLNIDAPKTDASDDELDIPAFLRRQAN